MGGVGVCVRGVWCVELDALIQLTYIIHRRVPVYVYVSLTQLYVMCLTTLYRIYFYS